MRQGIAVVVAILFGIALIGANHAGWLTTTVFDQDVFVNTLAPLPKDPAVAQALAEKVGAGIIETYEVQDNVAEALPENLAFIAVPVTEALEGAVSNIVAKIIESDAFAAVWSVALEGAHRAATVYLGLFDGDVLTEEEGVAILDFTAIGAQVNERLNEAGFDLLNDVDADLQVELFELPDAGLTRSIVEIMTSIRWALFFVTFGLLAIAYAVATNRRKISVWVGGATIFAMVASLILLRYLRSALTGGIEDVVQEAGAVAAWDIIAQRLIAQSWIMLLMGVIVAGAAWVSGDSERALSVRSSFVNAGRSARGEDSEPSDFAMFVADRRRLLEWGVVVIGVGVLLLAPPLPMGTILLAIVAIIAFVGAVEFIAASTTKSSEPEKVDA